MAKVSIGRCVRALVAILGAAPILGTACADVSVIGENEKTAPVILAVEPAKGPSEGGTPVVITGRGFVKGATVRFGGDLAEAKWVDAKAISAITPPGIGVVSVSVENPSHLVHTLEKGFTYEAAPTGGCAVISTVPETGAADVPIVGELRLAFSTPIDVASLEGAVKLRLIGGDEVPAEVTLGAETDSEIIVRPEKSLRFWGAYAVVVSDEVKATDGTACAPAALAFATVKPEALPRALRPASISGLALVNGFVVAASEGYRGLQTYDVSDVESAGLVSDVVTSFGPRGVVVRGQRAYAPSGFSGVQIFDVAAPDKPVLVGHGGTPGRANDVAVVEKNGRTFLLVADIQEGVRVLDATDAENVLDLGTLALGGAVKPSVLNVDVQGDRVAVGDGSRFVLLSLPDPAAPGSAAVLGSMDAGAALTDVLLDNNRLYVAKFLYGIASYDITDPAAPVLIDSEDDPDGTCPPGCLDSASSLVKDGGDLFAAFGRGGVVRFSVEGSGNLTKITNYVVPGNVRSIAVTATNVFAGGDEGLLVFERAGDGSKPSWFDPNGHGVARAIQLREGFAYVAASLRGIQTFSLADAEAPEFVDRDDTPASLTADVAAGGVSSDDGVLAVGDGRAGVTLFDLSDPKNPVLGGTIDTTDGVGAVVSVGNVAYACNGNGGIVAVDANDPMAPKQLGEVTFADFNGADSCGDLLPAGDLMYVARRSGLGVLDISDPTALAWKTIVKLPGTDTVTGVRQLGNHLLATTTVFDYEGTNNAMSRLRVFDATDAASPKLIWTSGDLGGAAGLGLVGDVAFVAAGLGVNVFDVSDIENPVLEGTIATPGNVLFTVPGVGVLYAAEGAGGLQAIRTGPLPQSK